MISKIDINSKEYKQEFENTVKFTDEVLEKYNFVYNTNNEVNEAIQMGLTRNQLIYGKRYCPCFMVIGNTKAEQEKSDNRVCPCTPALTSEIPLKGSCHCGIFNTPSKEAQTISEENIKSEQNSDTINLIECKKLLSQPQINSEQLEQLLQARSQKIIDFNLVDTREWMEWVDKRIVGTDYLAPTTSFYQAIKAVENQKETPVVVYCLSGSRSAYCQHIMLQMGFKSVTNLDYGISSFYGECESGE